jgi:amino acid permease
MSDPGREVDAPGSDLGLERGPGGESQGPTEGVVETTEEATVYEEAVELERTIDLRGGLAIGVGTMVGAGILVFPGLAAERAGPAAALSFALRVVVAFLIAF